MRFSVIIPTCHRNERLARCLARLAPGAQTIDASEYEVIVTDDGKQTTAEAMIREQFPWARWVAGPGRGPAANRNNGARHARGPWLVFTDDDCVPAPGWLAGYRDALDQGDAGAEVFEGKTTCEQGIRTVLDEAPVNLTGGGFPSCNLMVSKPTFERVGRFDEDFSFWCEDQFFGAMVRRLGIGQRFVADAVVDHPRRRRPSGWQMGLRWEGRILLWYKEGETRSVWRFFPIHCAKVRVRQMLSYPFGWDTIRACGALAVEWVCLMTHLARWDARYRHFGPHGSRPHAGRAEVNVSR